MKTTTVIFLFSLFVYCASLSAFLRQQAPTECNSEKCPVSSNTTEMCTEVDQKIAQLKDMDLNVNDILQAFQHHIDLVKKWRLDTTQAYIPSKAEKENYMQKEIYIMETYIQKIMEMQKTLEGLVVKLTTVKQTSCSTSSGTASGKSTGSGQIDEGTNSLIQKTFLEYNQFIEKVSSEFGSKLESVNFLQMKARTKKLWMK